MGGCPGMTRTELGALGPVLKMKGWHGLSNGPLPHGPQERSNEWSNDVAPAAAETPGHSDRIRGRAEQSSEVARHRD